MQDSQYGLYYTLKPFDLIFGDGQTPISPNYRKIPLLLTLLLAPIMGALFVMLFPIVIFLVPLSVTVLYLKRKVCHGRPRKERPELPPQT